jgi:2,4-dienoyl-CoA reductase-like NADH-dependent reductase (Old Yellow Enzyme family)
MGATIRDDKLIAGHTELTKAVDRYGCSIFLQVIKEWSSLRKKGKEGLLSPVPSEQVCL